MLRYDIYLEMLSWWYLPDQQDACVILCSLQQLPIWTRRHLPFDLIHLDCIHAPPKPRRIWEIHPRCQRDFLRPRKSWGSRETSRVLVEHRHSLIIHLYEGSGSGNQDWMCKNQSFPADDDRMPPVNEQRKEQSMITNVFLILGLAGRSPLLDLSLFPALWRATSRSWKQPRTEKVKSEAIVNCQQHLVVPAID